MDDTGEAKWGWYGKASPDESETAGGTLSWIPSKPVATGYQISRSGTRDGSFAPWKETAESSIALPQEEGTFWYRVRAVSQENGVLVGVSPLSDAVSYTWTAPAEPPEPQQPEPDPPAAPADPRPSVPSTPQNPGEMPDSVMHEFLVAMEFGMDKLGDGLDRISSANRFGGKGLSAAGSQFSQMAQSCYGDAKEYFARARDICLAYPQARDMEEIGDLLLQVCNEIDRVVSFSVDSGNYAYFIRAIFLSATDSISDCTGRIIQLLQQQQ